jgi:hypothetical protein
MDRRLSYANVVSTLALGLALGGGAVYAADKIGSSQIARSAVHSKQIKNQAVKSVDVRDDAITGANIREDSLGTVPAAQTANTANSAATANSATTADSATTATTATTAGHADTADTADNASNLGGTAAAGYLRYGSNIPSGRTVTGAFGQKVGGATDYNEVVSFYPLRAPANVLDADVNFSDDAFTAGAAMNSDEDSACTGSVSNPTAPDGNVCLYLEGYDVAANSAFGSAFVGGLTEGSRHGFSVNAGASMDSAGGTFLAGTWAYTAP